MTTKSQRKKQQEKQRQRKRLRERQRKRGVIPPSSDNHRQQQAKQKPLAWTGEAREDVAVFDDSVLETLPADLVDQVSAVREAIQAASESRGDDALKCVSGISRNSPLSPWRLFVRGYVLWMDGEIQAASEVWERLDQERRPGRIGITLLAAVREDLDHLSATDSKPTSDTRADELATRLDRQLLDHAKLVRRIRFDRAAIRDAEAGVRLPEETRELLLGPKKTKWLRNFATEYRTTEPELVAALEEVALGRAFVQTFGDMFETAIRSFPGPPHDRKNSLLSFFYYIQFESDRAAEQAAEKSLEKYLSQDLPRNEFLSEPLRNAIASQIHLNEAIMTLAAGQGMMGSRFGGREDTKSVSRHFDESAQAYPANRQTYKAHTGWIKSKLASDRLTKPQRKPHEEQLAVVMKSWTKGLPDDVEPRLWLVDHYLENEELEDAKPQVDWLAASRQDDPRVRATPWKWQLLEAMRLCRRKAWLSEVPDKLDEAEKQWPAWLSHQWLPYLRAAWILRRGDTDDFEQRRLQICSEAGILKESLADACMMLGAAQRMRVSSADLKPLRAPVDAAVKGIGKLPYDELLLVSGFFCDLHRAGLQYPAYRMHGGKFMRELYSRWESGPGLVLNNLDDKRIHAAVYQCSEHRFWSDPYELRLPDWYMTPKVRQYPIFAAARLNAFLQLRVRWRNESYRDIGPLLRQAAPSQSDPYYRHWFVSLADQFDEVVASEVASPFRFGSSPFGDVFYDDDDDDDWEFDPDCDCPECRAASRAHQAAQR